ncbi:MAG: flippase [Candidatus Kryptoniota bacterium]
MSYSIAKSIVKNTTIMMSAQMITWVSGFILLLFLPRYLGSKAFGELYLAMSIQIICQWLIDYGGANYISKEIARDRISGHVAGLMTDSAVLRLGLWSLTLVLTLALCIFAKYAVTVTILIMTLGISNVWGNMTTLLRECYQGFEEMKYPSIGAVAERSFLMLTAVLALLLGAGVTVIVILMAVSTIFSFGISWKYSKTMFRFNHWIDKARLRRVLSEGFPYFLWSLFGIIYYRIDAVMLSLMAPDSVVGWYGAAYRFFDILMFLPAIFSQALFPILSRLSTSEYSSMKDTSQKSLELLLLAGIPIACGLIFFSREIIQILFGLAQYTPSIVVLQIFSVGMLLVYADFVLGSTVIALDKQKQWAAVAFGAMILNIAMNLFLIKYFQTQYSNGGIGSAIATDLTELFIMTFAIRLLPKELFTRDFFLVIAKGISAGILMALTIAGLRVWGLPFIAQGFAGAVVYILALIVLSTFKPSEVELFTRAISVKRLREVMTTGKG